MEPFQHCAYPGCNRKYKTRERLEKHTLTHNGNDSLDMEDSIIGSVSGESHDKSQNKYFYLCPEMNCNKKFKQLNTLNKHLVDIHKIINKQNIEPVLINKENKKEAEEKRNNTKKRELHENKIAEIEKEAQMKKQVDEEIKQKYREQCEQIEKLKIEKEILELEIIKKCNERTIENPDKCSICFDNGSDTAIIPCGHKFFCYECINDYRFSYAHRGCPICRSKITDIIKTFS